MLYFFSLPLTDRASSDVHLAVLTPALLVDIACGVARISPQQGVRGAIAALTRRYPDCGIFPNTPEGRAQFLALARGQGEVQEAEAQALLSKFNLI